MSWTCGRSLRAAALLLAAAPAAAAAQGIRETQVFGVALASKPVVFAAGAGLAWRDRGRSRIGGALAAGTTEDGGVAGRAEATYHFLLDPLLGTGAGLYGGGGLALTAFPDGRVRPWVQLVLGVESAPGAPRGTFFEIGLGGGVRVAAGVRFRKQNAPGR